MSDKFRSLIPIDTKFVQGEQPTDKKLSVLHGLTKRGMEEIEKILGPAYGADKGIWMPYLNLSSRWFFSIDRPSLLNGQVDESTQRSLFGDLFNITRLIGPASLLNNETLASVTVNRSQIGQGLVLEPGRNSWQLPWAAANFSDPEFTGTHAWVFAVNVGGGRLEQPGHYKWDSERGFLESFSVLPEGATSTAIKYDLSTGKGSGALGSTYNVIPDPSILTLTDSERATATGSPTDFGGIGLTVTNVTGDTITMSLSLPKVISRWVSVATGLQTVTTTDIVGNSTKRYILPPSLNSYPEGIENIVKLYNNATGEYYDCLFTSDGTVTPSYSVTLNKVQALRIPGISESIGSSNRKDIFLIINSGSTITENIRDLRDRAIQHKHNGLDSEKLSHKDLIDSHTMGTYDPEILAEPEPADTYGANQISSRVYRASSIFDNVHPQYHHRRGFAYGANLTKAQTDAASTFDQYGSGTFISSKSASTANELNLYDGIFALAPMWRARREGSSNVLDQFYSWDRTSVWDIKELVKAPGHAIHFGILGPKSRAIPLYNADNPQEPYGGTRLGYWNYSSMLPFSESEASVFPSENQRSLTLLEDAGPEGAPVDSRTTGAMFYGGNVLFNMRPYGSWFPHLIGRFGVANIFVTANQKNGSLNQKTRLEGFRAIAEQGAASGVSSLGLTPGGPAEGLAYSYSYILAQSTFGFEASGSTQLRRGVAGHINTELSSTGAGLFASPSVHGSNNALPWEASLNGTTEHNAGWRNNNTLGQSLEQKGGTLHLFAFAKRTFADLNNNLGRIFDSPKGPVATKIGQVIVEGDLGIKFIVPSTLDSFSDNSSDETVSWGTLGFHRYMNETGYNKLESRTGRIQIGSLDNRFFWHKEVQFWGTDDVTKGTQGPDITSSSINNTRGTNINLLYGINSAYRKFGLNLAVDSFSVEGESSNDNRPWMTSRTDVLRSADPKDYGSAIRNASFIDAYKGIRHDPWMPYIKEYVIPFTASVNLGANSWEPEPLIVTQFTIPSGDKDGWYTYLENAIGNTIGTRQVFIDQVVREIEEEYLITSGLNLSEQWWPAKNIASVSVSLDHWILVNSAGVPQPVIIGDGEEDFNNDNVIATINAGGKYVPASWAQFATGETAKINTVISNGTFATNEGYSFDRTLRDSVPYMASIVSAPVDTSGTFFGGTWSAYKAMFPHYEIARTYWASASRWNTPPENQYGLRIDLQYIGPSRYRYRPSTPYYFTVDEGDLVLHVTGRVVIKGISLL